MSMRRTHYLAGGLAALVASLGAVPPAQAASSMRTVFPGESIQKAVDAAAPGSTVQLMPGTYHESVLITRSDITLRGVGPSTVLVPDPAQTGNACATAGHGICVAGTDDQKVNNVRIGSLTVSGYRMNGIDASNTDHLRIMDVGAFHNGNQGISQEKSIRATLTGNEAADNVQAGIFLANSVAHEGGAIDTQGTVIRGNRLSGNRIGVVVRRARTLAVDANDISGNCGGVFVVGDEGSPKPGAISVNRNYVHENNKYCPPNPRLAFIQGTGILFTGAEDSVVSGNQIEGNRGDSPMSGGVVLFPSVTGTPNNRISVTGNVLADNGPADLADRDTGTGNTFARNTCGVSEPAGRC
ncbi:right-handed parallel beta-helix repeat-containing protein [Kitasatospora sp. NPDC093679]|uniref:right-handed parallel beta-helix repeat-containing protein n=1 Tax=Kitasatospora sp. NPDC093679 TaxID=3154983 RepID=UPI003443F960